MKTYVVDETARTSRHFPPPPSGLSSFIGQLSPVIFYLFSLTHLSIMWPSWARRPCRQITAPASPSHRSFASSSFKDIHSLFSDDDVIGVPLSTLTPPVKKYPSIFHRVRIATSALRSWHSIGGSFTSPEEKRVVVYFTSLRVVRKTFEDCRSVRSILRGFRVAVDERDLSMDSKFLNELKGILGNRQLTLPRVFIGGRYMGGAEEIRYLHETGELKKLVEGINIPEAESGVCECCGGVTFVLCENCNGSRKFYSDKNGFRSCTSCNENGLTRCLHC
ncbi:Glutaredoxin family protein [Zostera marina]|uniref:Glutaredoxin family protein n=1 Tax=Zostera marina TaxID=29655 RepID=A0A0K9PS41_ZOSMR|nr:Glutaredoxin family protein [Zostera marina]